MTPATWLAPPVNVLVQRVRPQPTTPVPAPVGPDGMNERTEELDVNAAEPVHREAEDTLWLPAGRPIPVLPAGHAENSFRFFCFPGHGVTSLTRAKRFRPHHGN